MKDAELLGWISVVVLMSNYLLTNLKIFSPISNPKIFFAVQLLGASLMLVTALLLNFLPLIVMEGIVIAVNVFHLMKLFSK
jgi:hypothetical protein